MSAKTREQTEQAAMALVDVMLGDDTAARALILRLKKEKHPKKR